MNDGEGVVMSTTTAYPTAAISASVDRHAQGFDMHPQLMPVPFHGDTVMLVGQDNDPFVAMKPIVTNMGLDWKSQHAKLSNNTTRWGMVIITTPSLGGAQEAVCLPLRKLASWLMTINPNKVKPDLRDKIIRYQEECDDALWDYWTKGSASRPGSTSVNQQIALSRHRVALLKELHRTRDNTLRSALHDQLALVSQQLGLSVPILESIGQGTPSADELLEPLWAALRKLDALGIAYNHSKKPEQILALHWSSLNKTFAKYEIPFRVKADIKEALRASFAPNSPLQANRQRD
ncbi:phage antirepressor N-terminal domain-containing protein [Pseudomonas entomophila]|uniref:phage antirepressor N-terminal domain-containing protein n=1 Tax=Pseudomonas entomophila TaxID=312306 RepID=UPI0023D7EE3A|nr:phage antirepressor N-terminal domain-containing protein [Pseudomonas entomophila]MDF0729695.1 phage antirepressor N-terminal domain-containing protein [Pseudomonas entomophila]